MDSFDIHLPINLNIFAATCCKKWHYKKINGVKITSLRQLFQHINNIDTLKEGYYFSILKDGYIFDTKKINKSYKKKGMICNEMGFNININNKNIYLFLVIFFQLICRRDISNILYFEIVGIRWSHKSVYLIIAFNWMTKKNIDIIKDFFVEANSLFEKNKENMFGLYIIK